MSLKTSKETTLGFQSGFGDEAVDKDEEVMFSDVLAIVDTTLASAFPQGYLDSEYKIVDVSTLPTDETPQQYLNTMIVSVRNGEIESDYLLTLHKMAGILVDTGSGEETEEELGNIVGQCQALGHSLTNKSTNLRESLFNSLGSGLYSLNGLGWIETMILDVNKFGLEASNTIAKCARRMGLPYVTERDNINHLVENLMENHFMGWNETLNQHSATAFNEIAEHLNSADKIATLELAELYAKAARGLDNFGIDPRVAIQFLNLHVAHQHFKNHS